MLQKAGINIKTMNLDQMRAVFHAMEKKMQNLNQYLGLQVSEKQSEQNKNQPPHSL